jgi:RNA polymerase sigma-70 factor (ECF subfamily)
MSVEASFGDLMVRLRRGDGSAAAAVFHQYARRLVGLARSRLNGRLRQKVDPEDVVQSAFGSFFRRQAGGDVEVGSWDSLWSLLAVITVRKCGRWAAYFRTARRDVRREVAPRPGRDDFGPGPEGEARGPTPAEAAMLAETVEGLARSLDARERRILELSLEGLKAPQISARLGCSERTVFRMRERIKTRLRAESARKAG